MSVESAKIVTTQSSHGRTKMKIISASLSSTNNDNNYYCQLSPGESFKEQTYVTTLCNAYAIAHAASYLTHVHHARYADNFQISVVVRRPHKLVVLLLAPRIRTSRPAVRKYTNNPFVHSIIGGGGLAQWLGCRVFP